jgi:hypothetical protein
MNWIQRLALWGLGLASTVSLAWAQAASPGPSNAAPLPGVLPGARPDVIDASTSFVLVSAVVILLLIVGVGVKAYDLKRKREQDAAALQARISDALMVDPLLSPFPITPTVRIPVWSGKPVMLEVSGTVPGAGLRQAAVDLVLREALRSGRTCRLVDRISVDPGMIKRAA